MNWSNKPAKHTDLTVEALRDALVELREHIVKPPRVEFIVDPIPPEMADHAPPENFNK